MSEQNKKIIAGLHRKNLTNIKFASALLDMAIEEKKDDLNFALQQAKEVQQIAAKESRKKNSIEFATLYWKATLMLAPYFFEDFLYYMEKDRAPDKRFYPRLYRYNKIKYMHGLGKWQHIKLPKRPPTKGETLAKAMLTMEQEYGVHFLFCHPNEAGAKVVELLEGGCDDDRRTKAVG